MICLIREVIITIVFILDIIQGVVLFGVLCKSVVRKLIAADVAFPRGAPFMEVPDTKTVKTLRESHIGRVGDNIGI